MNTVRIPAAEAKKHLPDYLARSSHGECRIIVTRRGRPMAAIVSMNDLQELEQHEERMGLSSAIGKWKGFADIAEDVADAREAGGDGRDVSL